MQQLQRIILLFAHTPPDTAFRRLRTAPGVPLANQPFEAPGREIICFIANISDCE